MGLWEGLYDIPPVPPFPKFSNRHSGVPVSTTKMCFKENEWLVGCWIFHVCYEFKLSWPGCLWIAACAWCGCNVVWWGDTPGYSWTLLLGSVMIAPGSACSLLRCWMGTVILRKNVLFCWDSGWQWAAPGAWSVICLVCVLLCWSPQGPVSLWVTVWRCWAQAAVPLRAGAAPAGQPAGKSCGASKHEWLQAAAACMLRLERSSRGNCLCSGSLELRLLPGHSSSTFAGQPVYASWCLLPESLMWQG